MAIYFWIAIGSAFGASRASGAPASSHECGETFPECYRIRVIGLIAARRPRMAEFLSAPRAHGRICGGYTTFSSFSLQTMNLMNDGEWLYGGANIVGSVTLCLLAVWAGMMLGASFNAMKWDLTHATLP